MRDIYFEHQRGGLCRKHSLNAFFGREQLTEQDFWKAADEFDKYQETMFNQKTSCRSFDLINSDQQNLVSYVLSKYNIYTRYVAINHHTDEELRDAMNTDAFFVFNENHIWIMKKVDDKFYKVDSMGGISQMDPMRLRRERDIGIMIPIRDTRCEFQRLVNKMRAIVGPCVDIYLREQHAAKNIMGDLEIVLGAIMEILRVQMSGRRVTFVFISSLLENYSTFIKHLSTGKYNDLPYLLSHIPTFIEQIYRIMK